LGYWEKYTGHCFRRYAASAIAVAGGSAAEPHRAGSWKSAIGVAQGYFRHVRPTSHSSSNAHPDMHSSSQSACNEVHMDDYFDGRQQSKRMRLESINITGNNNTIVIGCTNSEIYANASTNASTTSRSKRADSDYSNDQDGEDDEDHD